MDSELLLLAFYFFVIAIIYSSAGFGGGSSYIAVLTLFSLPFTELRMIALLCNIIVVSNSVYLLWHKGFLRSIRIVPLIILSVPCAYLGGRYRIEEDMFYMLLGVTLLIASALMLLNTPSKSDDLVKKLSKYSNAFIGGGIGFLSGLVGIGGGIFLSPVLHLSRWGKVKSIAATTALFILVNSISGLAGQIMTNGWALSYQYVLTLMISVFIGGQLGVRLTIYRLNPETVKRITALLIMIVAIRILFF